MRKLIVLILFSIFMDQAFSQDLKILDLSKGGLRIANVLVKKNKTNQFVIVSDSTIAISQVAIYADASDTIKVKDIAVPNTLLYKGKVTKYTDFKIGKDKDTLQLFAFEGNHNYQIEHNKKKWNIIVRKKKNIQTNLYLKKSNLYIGDSCIALHDTMYVTLKDSFVISKWDSQLSLFINGVHLKDSLYFTVDDSCCYFAKALLGGHQIIQANDTLSVRLSNGHSYVVIFKDLDRFQSNNLWWLLLPVLLIVGLLVKKKRKTLIRHLPWLTKNQDYYQVPNDEISKINGGDVSKVDIKHECWCWLNKHLDELLKILQKKINGLDKNKLFVQRDNIESLLDDLAIVEATNKTSLIKKCEEIRQYIKKNQINLTEDASTIQNFKYDYSETLVKEEHQNEEFNHDWFEDILTIIDALKFEGDNSNIEGLNISTIDQIKDKITVLCERIANEIQITKERVNENVTRSWQARYDSLSNSYKELKELYDMDVLTAAEEARHNVEEAFDDVRKKLEKRANDAEEKAQKIEESKTKAIAEAVQKEKNFITKEIQQLKEDKQKAEKLARLAEQTKMQAIEDAINKEKLSHEKVEKKLKEDKENSEIELNRTTNTLKITQKELRDTITDRDKKIKEIQQLTKAQENYTRFLTSVPFAETYSKQIYELLKLGSQIQTAAYAILDNNVEDPYFIMKAISKYGKMIDGIDMENFFTDINMVSKANFVFKDSSLATFKEDNKDIDSIVRDYFYNQYLEKYINAIMVLNESMSGLKLLLPEVQSKVIAFDKYRNDILQLAKKLKVSILFVKVGDMAGENIDLKAKTVDVEIGRPGQILEIENCIVYPMDNRKPQTKIKVTIKK